jgi:hypothetical protein
MSRTSAEQEHEESTPAPRATATIESTFEVGAADDQHEHAADRTADQVLRRLAEQGELGGDAGGSGSSGGGSGAMGREGGAVDAATAGRIRSSSGSALPGGVRRSMEGAFGASFGSVRLHTGPSAAALSSQLGARAFTVGNDVFLGRGTPSLSSRQGQHLLAHELAHTQQDGGGAHRSIHRKFGKGATLEGWTKGDLPDTARETTTSTTDATTNVTTSTTTIDSDRTEDETATTGEQLGEVGGLAAENAGVMNQVDTINSYTSDLNDADGGDRAQIGSDAQQDNLTYAGTAVAGFAFLVEGSMAVQKWRSGFKDGQEAWEAFIGVTSAATGTASAIGNSVKAAEGGDGQKVEGQEEAVGAASAVTQEAASILAEIAGIVGTIKAGYEAAKAIIKAIQTSKGLETGDVRTAGIMAVRAATETGKAVMETINTFMSHLGTVTGPMLNAVPGLGIALGVLDIIANTIALGIAHAGWAQMREDKRAAKVILIGARDLQRNKTRWGGNISAVDVAAEILDDTNSMPEDVEAAKNYELSRQLQLIGGKRIRRNALNISAALPGIAGDIAMLSGAAAGVGVGLKAAGSGIKGLSALLRFGKQKVHDKLKTSKSTTNKRIAYDKAIMGMTANVIAANEIPVASGPVAPGAPDINQARTDKQESAMQQVLASGMSATQMKRQKGDGKALWSTWITALRNRDGLG